MTANPPNPPTARLSNPPPKPRSLLPVIISTLLIAFSISFAVHWVLPGLTGARNPAITWEQVISPSPILQTTPQPQQAVSCSDWQFAGAWKGTHKNETLAEYKAVLKQIGAADNNHIWAIGSVWKQLSAFPPNDSPPSWREHPNLIVQWDGANWSQVYIPTIEALVHDSVSFKVLHPISATDVWLARHTE